MGIFFCSHKRLSDIKSDGFQYCESCNKAFPVKCNHKWEVYSSADVISGRTNSPIGKRFVLRCEKCGAMSDYSYDV